MPDTYVQKRRDALGPLDSVYANTTLNEPIFTILARTPGGKHANPYAPLIQGEDANGEPTWKLMNLDEPHTDKLQLEVFNVDGSKALDYQTDKLPLINADAWCVIEVNGENVTLSTPGHTETATLTRTNIRETVSVRLGSAGTNNRTRYGPVYVRLLKGAMRPEQREAELALISRRRLLIGNPSFVESTEHKAGTPEGTLYQKMLDGLPTFDSEGNVLPGNGGLNDSIRASPDLVANNVKNGGYHISRRVSSEVRRLIYSFVGSGGKPAILDTAMNVAWVMRRGFEGPGCLPLTPTELGQSPSHDPYLPRNYGTWRSNEGWGAVPNYLAEFDAGHTVRRQLLEGSSPNGSPQASNEPFGADRQENSIAAAICGVLAVFLSTNHNIFAIDDPRTQAERDAASANRLEMAAWLIQSARDIYDTWADYTAATSANFYGRSKRLIPQAIDCHFSVTDITGSFCIAMYERMRDGGDLATHPYYLKAVEQFDILFGNPQAGRATEVSTTNFYSTRCYYRPNHSYPAPDSIFQNLTEDRPLVDLPEMLKFGTTAEFVVDGKECLVFGQIEQDAIQGTDGLISRRRELQQYPQHSAYIAQTAGYLGVLHMLGFEKVTVELLTKIYNGVNAGFFNSARVAEGKVANDSTDWDRAPGMNTGWIDQRLGLTGHQGHKDLVDFDDIADTDLTCLSALVGEARLSDLSEAAYNNTNQPSDSAYPFQKTLRRKALEQRATQAIEAKSLISQLFALPSYAAFPALRRALFNPVAEATIYNFDNGKFLGGAIFNAANILPNPENTWGRSVTSDHSLSDENMLVEFAPHPQGPWGPPRTIIAPHSFGGKQQETSRFQKADDGTVFITYQLDRAEDHPNITGDAQATFRATINGTDGLTWNEPVIHYAPDNSSGDRPHSGYDTGFFEIPSAIRGAGHKYVGFHSLQATSNTNGGIKWGCSFSNDGLTVSSGPHNITEQMKDLAVTHEAVPPTTFCPFTKNGELYFVAADMTLPVSGGAPVQAELCIIKLTGLNGNDLTFEMVEPSFFLPDTATFAYEDTVNTGNLRPVNVIEDGPNKILTVRYESKRLVLYALEGDVGPVVRLTSTQGAVSTQSHEATISVEQGSSSIGSVQFRTDGGALQNAVDKGNGNYGTGGLGLVDGVQKSYDFVVVDESGNNTVEVSGVVTWSDVTYTLESTGLVSNPGYLVYSGNTPLTTYTPSADANDHIYYAAKIRLGSSDTFWAQNDTTANDKSLIVLKSEPDNRLRLFFRGEQENPTVDMDIYSTDLIRGSAEPPLVELLVEPTDADSARVRVWINNILQGDATLNGFSNDHLHAAHGGIMRASEDRRITDGEMLPVVYNGAASNTYDDSFRANVRGYIEQQWETATSS